jgi:hypothetical protein
MIPEDEPNKKKPPGDSLLQKEQQIVSKKTATPTDSQKESPQIPCRTIWQVIRGEK